MIFGGDGDAELSLSESQRRQADLLRQSWGLALKAAVESLSRWHEEAGGLLLTSSAQLEVIDRLCLYAREAFGQYTDFLLENCESYPEYCQKAEAVGMRATAEVASKWREIGEYVTLLPQDCYDDLPQPIEDREVKSRAFMALRESIVEQAAKAARLFAERERHMRLSTAAKKISPEALVEKPTPADLIERWLGQSGVTVADALERMGLRQTAFYVIKAGKRWASDSSYNAVARTIKCNPSDLYPTGCTERPSRKKPREKRTTVARRKS